MNSIRWQQCQQEEALIDHQGRTEVHWHFSERLIRSQGRDKNQENVPSSDTKWVYWQVAVIQQEGERFKHPAGGTLKCHSHSQSWFLGQGSGSVQLGVTLVVSGDNKWRWSFYQEQTDSRFKHKSKCQPLFCSDGRLNPSHWQYGPLAWGFTLVDGMKQRGKDRGNWSCEDRECKRLTEKERRPEQGENLCWSTAHSGTERG